MQSPADLLLPGIDRAGPVPLLRQIYLALRGAILAGVLPPGARLPPSRALAADLGVARNSVVAAYEQLLAEGFVRGRVGAGTFVAADLPDVPEPAPAPPAPRETPSDEALDLYGTAPFTTGRVALDQRTLEVWRRLTLRHLRRPDPRLLGYSDPRGAAPLRQAIAAYLRAARAVRCEPEQVVVTAGAQQALDLVLRVLIAPGDAVWVEDPCYPAVQAALVAARARIVPVPVDAQGLDVAAGVAAAPEARLAYVTPSSHYPLGMQLSMPRRLELLAWARRSGAHVLEDDYDSEFRYAGRPLASLQGVDEAGRVIYVGTFSKVLFPGLRLGYAVLPPALLDPVLAARRLSDWHPAVLQEAVVTDFLAEGHFTQHLRRMRLRYRIARDALADALAEAAPGLLLPEPPEQGMKLLARLGDGLSDVAVSRAAAAAGIVARAVSPMYLAAPPVQALMLGFTGHEPAALRRAARKLGEVVRACC
jgi:GntR family transcriptional regulator/MocR family aminotransferase